MCKSQVMRTKNRSNILYFRLTQRKIQDVLKTSSKMENAPFSTSSSSGNCQQIEKS